MSRWVLTKVDQLQIPINGYYRASARGEYSCGSSIVMTDGVSSTRNSSANAEALNKFIFDYDGKKRHSNTENLQISKEIRNCDD